MNNRIVKASAPLWLRRIQPQPIIIDVPAQRQQTAVENHPDYFPVLSALNERRVGGELVSITRNKPECDHMHDIYAVQLGWYWYERRVVFALVRIGGHGNE